MWQTYLGLKRYWEKNTGETAGFPREPPSPS
jgi:hypothetical protein